MSASERFGNGEVGGSHHFEAPVHGYMEGYGDVTVAFGQGTRLGESLLADGHIRSQAEFDGQKGNRGHEHYNGRGGGADHRGRYNGPGH